mgnify:CR=1 FL=1
MKSKEKVKNNIMKTMKDSEKRLSRLLDHRLDIPSSSYYAWNDIFNSLEVVIYESSAKIEILETYIKDYEI